jgi:hypothetical protein
MQKEEPRRFRSDLTPAVGSRQSGSAAWSTRATVISAKTEEEGRQSLDAFPVGTRPGLRRGAHFFPPIDKEEAA